MSGKFIALNLHSISSPATSPPSVGVSSLRELDI